MIVPVLGCEIVSSAVIAVVDPLMGSPQHGDLADDNQKKLALPEMYDQMILPK